MAGNERKIAEFLISNINKLTLPHIGLIKSIGAPVSTDDKYKEINNLEDIDRFLSTEDSRKKADIYINGEGVSIKQTGSSFSYNRLQRANLIELFGLLKFNNSKEILERLDNEVRRFHNQELERRNRLWDDFFTEEEFKELTKFLMMKGAPNVGKSSHPAELVLEAPVDNISVGQLKVFTFEEYFLKYKNKFKIAIRRQWYGQASDSEHNRARSLMKKLGNAPWIFDDVAGTPNIHRKLGVRWRNEISDSERKTVYFLMIEKER